MSKSNSPGENNQQPCESPSTSFFRLDGKSPVPSEFRSPDTFSIIRLRSCRIARPHHKTLRCTRLLVSVSLQALPPSAYQLWTEDKIIPTPAVVPFRSNVIDFASGPRCWTGCALDERANSWPANCDDCRTLLGIFMQDDAGEFCKTKPEEPELSEKLIWNGFSVTSSRPFDAVVSAIKASIGNPDIAEHGQARQRAATVPFDFQAFNFDHMLVDGAPSVRATLSCRRLAGTIGGLFGRRP